MRPKVEFVTFIGENPKSYHDIMTEVFEDSPFEEINFETSTGVNTPTILRRADYEQTNKLFIIMSARNNNPACEDKVYRGYSVESIPNTLFGEQYQRNDGLYNELNVITETIKSANYDQTIKYIDDSEGKHIGIFCYPNMCSLFYGMTVFADEIELSIFKKTMQQIRTMLPESKEELENYAQVIEHNRNIAMIKEIFQSELSKKERELRSIEDSITSMKTNLRNLIMQRTNAMWQTEKLKENLECDAKSMFAEIENMKRMHAVKKVVLDRASKSLLVFTDMIYIPKNKNQSYKIGEFKITIPIADPLSITFENLIEDLRRYSCWGQHCHHPHVSEAGHACFGNAEDTLAELSAQKEWCTFVSFLISYLESVNTADAAGKNVWRWPLVSIVDGHEVEQRIVECLVCGEPIRVDDGEVSYTCDRCGRENICKNCIITNDNGSNWCEDCYDDYRRSCGNCGATILIEGDHEYSDYQCDRCGTYVCDDCAIMAETLTNGTKRYCPGCHEILSRPSIPMEPAEVENDLAEEAEDAEDAEDAEEAEF